MNYHKRLTLYLALLSIVILCMSIIRLSLWKEDEPRDLPDIVREGILRIAIDYNPQSYYIQGDSVVGFEYRLARMIGEESGLAVELYPEINLQKSLDGLNERQFDIVARPLPVTTQNKQSYNFTEPIRLNRQVLVQRKASYNGGKEPIRNQLDLAQKRLHIIPDESTQLRIKNLSHEIGDTIYTIEEELYGYEQLIILVAKGEVDFAVCNQDIARQMSQTYPEIDIETDISFTQFQSWAVRKESIVLLDSLNSWLGRIQQRPDFQKMLKADKISR